MSRPGHYFYTAAFDRVHQRTPKGQRDLSLKSAFETFRNCLPLGSDYFLTLRA